MKKKYITTQILLACLSTPVVKKNIHEQLEETIVERKRILRQLESFSRTARKIDLYLDISKAA